MFLTTEDLFKYTQISNNVDVKLLQPHLEIAYDMYIRPVLGIALAEDLKNKYNTNTLTVNEQVLIDEYINPALAYYTWFSAVPFLQFKTTVAGIVKQTTPNSESVGTDEYSLYSKRVESTAVFYTQRLQEYLDTNSNTFASYRSSGAVKHRGSGLYLNFRKKH